MAYSDTYFHTVTCLLVSKKRGRDIKSIADLNKAGRIVVVKEGTTGHFAAEEKCAAADVRAVETENDAANEVALGRADAFLAGNLQLVIALLKLFGPQGNILLQPVAIFGLTLELALL